MKLKDELNVDLRKLVVIEVKVVCTLPIPPPLTLTLSLTPPATINTTTTIINFVPNIHHADTSLFAIVLTVASQCMLHIVYNFSIYVNTTYM